MKRTEKIEAEGYTFDDNADDVYMRMNFSRLYDTENEARDEYNNYSEKPVFKVTITIERVSD